MRTYVLTRSAQTDLRNIADYIAQDSERASARWRLKIRAAVEFIALNPGLGRSRAPMPAAFLVWPAGAYVIIYRRETRPIRVIAVLHGARDLPTLLSRRLGE